MCWFIWIQVLLLGCYLLKITTPIHCIYFHLRVICSIYETVSNVIWAAHTVLCLDADFQQCLPSFVLPSLQKCENTLDFVHNLRTVERPSLEFCDRKIANNFKPPIQIFKDQNDWFEGSLTIYESCYDPNQKVQQENKQRQQLNTTIDKTEHTHVPRRLCFIMLIYLSALSVNYLEAQNNWIICFCPFWYIYHNNSWEKNKKCTL